MMRINDGSRLMLKSDQESAYAYGVNHQESQHGHESNKMPSVSG